MSHQDKRVKSAHLRQAVQWLMRGVQWNRPLHASCTWTFHWLAVTALFWAWSSENTLGERLFCAQRLTIWLQKLKKKMTSFQAFIEILERHTAYISDVLLQACRTRMVCEFAEYWEWFGYVIFGVDGSDILVPRTKSNEAAFTTNGESKHQNRQKKKTKGAEKLRKCPRILMTTLYHLRLGLPWDWRLGGKSDSERGHLIDMLTSLPKKAMVVGDAGFVGYQFLAAVLECGAALVVRVGSNVTLLKELGCYRQSDGIVYLWPDSIAKKSMPPLMFRLVVLQGAGTPVSLITSVLNAKRLSDKQVAKIYRERWGIELYHRHLKQTLGCHKTLSRTPQNALLEVQWIILGFLAMTTYATDQFIRNDFPLNKMSMANVFRAFRRTARDYRHPIDRDTLNAMIRVAQKDEYERKSDKTSRDYPQKRKHKPPGPPEVKMAEDWQKEFAKALEDDP